MFKENIRCRLNENYVPEVIKEIVKTVKWSYKLLGKELTYFFDPKDINTNEFSVLLKTAPEDESIKDMYIGYLGILLVMSDIKMNNKLKKVRDEIKQELTNKYGVYIHNNCQHDSLYVFTMYGEANNDSNHILP